MADYVERYSGKASDELEKQIRRVYKQAAEEVQKKLDDFIRGHKARNAQMLQMVSDGKMSKQDYQKWMRGQVFQGDQWKQKLKDVTEVYVHADEKAREIVGGTSKNVFMEAANYTAYDLEKGMRGAVAFNVYDAKTVERLLKKDPKMLPEWKIDQPKDYKWNEKRVRNAVAQGIIQGESVEEVGDRLTGELATSNATKMDMFARTAINGAQNAGRMDRLHEAEEMGIEIRKKWLATLDNRTRDTHQALDGQEQPIDEPFVVDGMKIDYPGDPFAPPELSYNCRCTLTYVYPKYQHLQQNHQRYDQESRKNIDYVTYNEWKQSADWKATAKKTKFEPTTDFSGVKEETATVYKNAVQKMAQEYPLRNSELSIADFRTAWNLPADTDLWDFTDENTEWQGVGAIFYGGKTQYPGGKTYDKPHIVMYDAEEHTGTSLEDALKYMADLREREGWKSEADSFFNAAIGAEADYVHEYGHALANDVGLYFGGEHFDELNEIFQKHSAEEISRDVSKYAKTNCEELFAEAFVLYHEPRLRTPLVNELMDLFFKYRR